MNPHHTYRGANTRHTGFTLLEVLTVIAILAVLLAISMISAHHSFPDRRQTDTEANLKTIVSSLSEYAAREDNTTGYPPAYGYLRHDAMGKVVDSLSDTDHVLEPYTFFVGLQDEEAVRQVDRYLRSHDTNGDGTIGLMEYLPVGSKDPASGDYTFSTTLYTGSNMPMSSSIDELQAQMDSERLRPYVYVPYNSRQLQTVTRYWVTNDDEFGERFDMTDPTLAALTFPPPVYDGFVLIGNGPGGNDGGLSSIAPPGTPGKDYDKHHVYHVLGLRIAFLAKRDWDPDGAGPKEPDGMLDFDYNARKQADNPFISPDGTRGYGAFIKVVQ